MIEAAVLTGGSSRRMGSDKAQLTVGSEPLALRTCRFLATVCSSVTVLGPEGIGEFQPLPDTCPNAGPLAAIAHLKPQEDLVMLVSCDIPRFDPRLVNLLKDRLGVMDAAIPELGGRLQPLCGLYRSVALEVAAQQFRDGVRSLMPWIGHLEVAKITDADLIQAGLDPRCAQGANTPEELAALLGDEAK